MQGSLGELQGADQALGRAQQQKYSPSRQLLQCGCFVSNREITILILCFKSTFQCFGIFFLWVWGEAGQVGR